MKPTRKQTRRARLRFAAKWAFISVTGVAAFMAFTALSIRAIEIEDSWRAERLCRIYSVCDPKRGP